MTYKQSLKGFIKGFAYAFNGIAICIKGERNFRFHMAAAFHLFAYLPFFKLTKGELCLLIMLCAAVFITEAVNTAVEKAIDSTGIVSSLAGAAKDLAAGAVLIAAACSVVCGLILLWQPDAFAAIFHFYLMYPFALLLQIATIGFWLWFVFLWQGKSQ